MKSYYYVFSPAGHAPRHKHETFDEAVTESRRLCELHPNQTFEILQCVAITSVPKPQVNTLYMDGVAPKTDESHIGFLAWMALPKIPDGYRQAVYRGMNWSPNRKCCFACMDASDNATRWHIDVRTPFGVNGLHYCEFIK